MPQKKWEVRGLAIIHPDGHLSMQGTPQLQFKAELKLHKGETARVTVTSYDRKKEEEDVRSLAQNRYYHKLLDIICDHTGDEHMDMHEELKVRLLSRPYVLDDKEIRIVKSTRELTTKEFGDYLEKVFKFASEEFNLTLPSPNQYY